MSQRFTDCLQDVDTAYISKVELGDKVSSLSEEFMFLKALYDAVCKHLLELTVTFVCILDDVNSWAIVYKGAA